MKFQHLVTSPVRITYSALIIAFVVLITFVLSVPRSQNEQVQDYESPSLSTTTPKLLITEEHDRGVRTFSGSLDVSNACTVVSAEAELVGNASSTQNIALYVIAPTMEGVCLQIPKTIEFEASIEAPEDLPVEVYVNGILVDYQGDTATTTSS